MSSHDDLQAIYASDPEAVDVVCGTGASRKRTRGFRVSHAALQQAAPGLQVPVRSVVLRIIAGSIGAPASDAVVDVARVRHRLLADLEPMGDGSEELLVLAKESV